MHRPLLLRIKQAYDEALHDAAAAACDNAYLSNKMSVVPHKHVGIAGAALKPVVWSVFETTCDSCVLVQVNLAGEVYE
jgi:hypothetical protein